MLCGFYKELLDRWIQYFFNCLNLIVQRVSTFCVLIIGYG